MPTPLTITAALNGSRAVGSHPRLPISGAALAADAVAVRAAGAGVVIVQVRNDHGAATLDSDTVDETVREIRRACPDVHLGVSTETDAELDARGKAKLVERWTEPDFAVVRLSEPGHADVMDGALWSGRAVAVVVATPGDVQRLHRSGLVDDVSRVYVAPDAPDLDGRQQVVLAGAIEKALDAAAVHVPRMHAGSAAGCWEVLRAAVSRGRDIRVGLADTLVMPDGRPAASNAALVRAARKLVEPAAR